MAKQSQRELCEQYVHASKMAKYYGALKRQAKEGLTRWHEEEGAQTVKSLDGLGSTMKSQTKAHVKPDLMPRFIEWCKENGFADSVSQTILKEQICQIIDYCKMSGKKYPDYVSDAEAVSMTVYSGKYEPSLPSDYQEVTSG